MAKHSKIALKTTRRNRKRAAVKPRPKAKKKGKK